MKKITFIVIITTSLYVLLTLFFPLIGLEKTLPVKTYEINILITLLLFALTMLYMNACLSNFAKNISIKYVLTTTSIFAVILIFAWPVGSSDVYNYINRARIITEHHENPYYTTYGGYPFRWTSLSKKC